LVIDSGFLIKHPCLSQVKILNTYDFIHNRTEVDNHPEDVFQQYFHGTYCLSLLSGQDPGNFYGVAPNASFLLAKTEDLRSETRIEEDNFIRAIEW
jgi:subtilisin family serine protease